MQDLIIDAVGVVLVAGGVLGLFILFLQGVM